jgi:dihydrofolate synthase/folylpolyglutamate synthase
VTIERDHEEHLGTTLAEIARERAGVLRPGRTTVLGDLPQRRGGRSSSRPAGWERAWSIASRGSDTRAAPEGLRLRTPRREHRLGNAFPAAHQRHNALVALRVLEEALDAGVGVDLDRVAAGISAARWPGRLE